MLLSGCAGKADNKEPTVSEKALKPVTEVRDQFDKTVSQIKAADYANISFDSLRHAEFPNCTQISDFELEEKKMDYEETMSAVEGFLQQYKEDIYSSGSWKKELRFEADSYMPDDKELEDNYPACYPVAADYVEQLRSREIDWYGFFSNTKDYYFQTNGHGAIMDFNLSLTNAAEGYKTNLAGAYWVENYHDSTKYYDSREKTEDKYLLIDKEVSIEEANDLVCQFLKKDPRWGTAKDFDVQTVGTDVYTIADQKHNYKVYFRRVYQGIPFDYDLNKYAHNEMSNGKSYDISIDYAVVCDSQTIDRMHFQNSGQGISKVTGQNETIFPLPNAVEAMSEAFSEYINFSVEQIELVYCPLDDPENPEKSQPVRAAWKFYGTNLVDDNKLSVYVDAQDGSVRYQTYYTKM